MTRAIAKRCHRKLPKDLPRFVALAVIEGVLNERRHMDDVWHEYVSDHGVLATVEPRDRAFARHLIATTLRHVRTIDAILRPRLKKWPRKTVPNILRLGVAELLYLGTPGHAVASRMVDLVTMPAARGLVNAVLRRIDEGIMSGDIIVGDPEDDIPERIMKRWRRTYGEATAVQLAIASLQEAALDVSVKDRPDYWAIRLNGKVLPTGTVRVSSGGAVAQMSGFDKGHWWVQDAAAALPVRLLGDVTNVAVADVCAAPGGKSAQLAVRGAHVTSIDISEMRLKRLEENMARLRLPVKTVVTDVLEWIPNRQFDAILLDAPCSATGTLRRHPDLMHLKGGSNILALACIQTDLLDHLVPFVKNGGLLVFCTCSLEPEEGEYQIIHFLKKHPNFERVPIVAAELGGEIAFITPEGDGRIRPDMWARHGGIDGFFMARLRRIAID